MKKPVVIGDATLYLGDCLAVFTALEPVDVVLTDPPYSEHVHSKARAGGRGDLAKDGYMASYSRVAEFGFPAITPEQRAGCAKAFASLCRRWIAVFSDVESCHLWRDELTGTGLDYCRTGIWRKLNATPQFTGDRPASGFETITLCHPKGRKRWNGGGRHAVWEHAIELNRGGKNDREHPTQKPLPLMADLVADFTEAGELVLDAFMGSGTTAVACIQQGRRFIGIERDPAHFHTACKRIEAAYAQGRLFEPEQPKPEQGDLLGNAA